MLLLLLLLACLDPSPTDTGSDPVDSRPPDSVDTGESGGDDADSVPPDSETAQETDTSPPPVDEDGDGYLSDVDCDDARVDVHPGAIELCDAVDHDCDGASLTDGVCSEVQDLAAVGGVFPDRDEPITTLLSDLDDDGFAELVSGASDPSGAAVYRGGAPAGSYSAPAEDADELFYVYGYILAGDYDVDADKVEDILFVGGYDYYGVKVVEGPFDLDGGVHYLDAVEPYWDYSTQDSEWLASGYAAGDWDGDGKTDFSAVEMDYEPYPWAASVWFGGSPGQPLVKFGNQEPYLPQDLLNMGDLDGDGGDDLLVESLWDNLYFVSGGDMRVSDGVPLVDAAMAVVAKESASYSLVGRVFPVGDLNDDGLADVALAKDDSTRGPGLGGEVFVLDGGTFSGEMSLYDVRASFVMPESVKCESSMQYVHPYVSMAAVADVDGVSGAEGWVGFGYCDPAHDTWLVPLRGDGQVQEWDAWLAFDSDNFLSGSGDADGDGCTDLIIRTPDNTYSLWYGWDVPWDEPQWWAPPE